MMDSTQKNRKSKKPRSRKSGLNPSVNIQTSYGKTLLHAACNVARNKGVKVQDYLRTILSNDAEVKAEIIRLNNLSNFKN